MKSIFSSFDSFIFLLSYFFVFTMHILVWASSFWLLSYRFTVFSNTLEFMGKFFNSLSSSNFSKNIIFFLLSLMNTMIVLNYSSIFPFIFSTTSQPSVILAFSLSTWMSVFLFSLFKGFRSLMSHLVPEGSPLGLALFLYIIEAISMFIRPITLMVRLVANILAGHLLVILLSSLVLKFTSAAPFLMFLNLVEMFVSVIQSYILVTLLCLYYGEI